MPQMLSANINSDVVDISNLRSFTAGTRYYFQNLTNTPIRITDSYHNGDDYYRVIPAYGDTLSIVQANISFDSSDTDGHIIAWVSPEEGIESELAIWTENPTT